MLKKVGLVVFLCFTASASVFAQATASISGRVVDQEGAVLPGVTVSVTNTATGAARDTITNGEGLYSIPALNPGSYTVTASLPGFKTVVLNAVVLNAGTPASVTSPATSISQASPICLDV